MFWNAKRTNHKVGLVAEKWAGWFLRLQFYRILAQRYRTPWGEIDIIATRRGCVHFIEVKSRASLSEGLYAVTRHQRERIGRSAAWFLARQGQDFKGVSFDVVILYNRLQIRHIVSAWRVGDS